MKSTLIKKSVIIFMCLFMMVPLTACGGAKKECKEVVEAFEIACRDSDVYGVLDCITPSVSDPIKMAINFSNMFTDVDLSEVFTKVLSGIMGSGSNEIDALNMFGSMELDITDVKKDSKEILVYVDIQYTLLGEPVDTHGVFRMEEKKDEWYIKGFNFVEEE